MDIFHVVIDTSILRRAHFQHPNFKRLLTRSQMGALKIYIPYIALEERRTQLVKDHEDLVSRMQANFATLQRDSLGMLTDGLQAPVLSLWDREEVERNSRIVLDKFMVDNKIEVIPISLEHATTAWKMYFDIAPPFDPKEERQNRRKDIPDSWILVAARGIKAKQGRHCALVADAKLKAALEGEGFEIYDDIEKLDNEVERATAVVHTQARFPVGAPIPLDQLRGPAFKDIDVIVLGVNEALNTPSKTDLFSALERAGVDRVIAEHEARTLVLSGRLTDTGSHFIPTNKALALQAVGADVVTNLLLRII